MFSLIALILLAFVVGLVVGAYSHKWLASITGAPKNLTAANAGPAAETAAQHLAAHATGAALAAVDSTAEAVKASILSK